MYWFRKNNNVIEKYNVIFDEKEVKELKREIIYKCSLIEHVRYESDYYPRFDDMDLIMNFKETPTDKSKAYDVETRNINLYTYDELKPPRLVELIERLINKDISCMDEILNYDVTEPNEIDIQIDKAKKELIYLITNDKPEYLRKEKDDELERLYYIKKLSQNREPVAPYYKRLLGLIEFELVDVMDIELLSKVEKFLELDLLKEYEFIDDNNEVITKRLTKKID